MLIDTKFFDKINVDNKKIIVFKQPILGFEDVKKYVLLTQKDKESPFYYLQAMKQKDLCFVIVDPTDFLDKYSPIIPKPVLKSLKLENTRDALLYTITVVPPDPLEIRTNLKAPIVINPNENVAAQVVLDDNRLTTRYYIMKEILKANNGNNKGSSVAAG